MQHGLLSEYQAHAYAGKLLFFDRAKKVLENRDIYEEFLKFLDLFSKDILDLATLVERAKVFFGDGELMTAFKDLVGWDDRDNLEKGPPGSIRTGPPELPGALPVEDGEGPSYRRVPPSVGFLRNFKGFEADLDTSICRRLCWLVRAGISSAARC